MRNLELASQRGAQRFGGGLITLRAAQEGPGLGVPATPEQVAGSDRASVRTAPACRRARARRRAGKTVYEAKCLACHGVDGAGSRTTSSSVVKEHCAKRRPSARSADWPYATTVFDYVRRAMPYVAAS